MLNAQFHPPRRVAAVGVPTNRKLKTLCVPFSAVKNNYLLLEGK